MARVIFVGNLPDDVRESEVEDIFKKYGKIVMVDVKKPSRPPTFAFVEFDDPRDAADACRARDGYDFAGGRIRVELAKGGGRRGARGGGYGGGFGGGISRRSKFRITIKGLPGSCSWQDLKDFARRIGDVTYANVLRDRDGQMGIVDFAYEEDMKYAIKKLDDTEFERGYFIRVREDAGEQARDSYRSRSPPRRRERSRSRSPARSASRSPARSLSKSPAGRSRSPSRSPARSLSR